MRPIPVCTSSRMRRAPAASQISRAAGRYSGDATWTPPSPWTASRITAAVSPSTAFRSASVSLYGTWTNPGTRGSNGSRKSRRHVALSAPIVRPWNPRIAATTFGRPVAARANFSAASTASDPELLRNTRRRFRGATERRRPVNAAFASVPNVGPTWISCRAWAVIASTSPRTNVGARRGEHANSTARASTALRRSPCPSPRAHARRGRGSGRTRSRPAGRRPRAPPGRRLASSSSSRTRSS